MTGTNMAGNQQFQSVQRLQFNKTETEYNMKSIRFLLLTITTMFIVIGILMIVVGISVFTHYHNFSYFYNSDKHGLFFTPSILMVFMGVMMLVITSFGFFGSLRKSTCMVNLYALFLAVLLLIKLVAVILAFTKDTNKIMRYFEIPVWEYANDPEIEYEIDNIQVNLNCCGYDSFLDYVGVDFTTNHSTLTYHERVEGDLVSVVLPSTCCLHPLDDGCTRLRPRGCRDALASFIVQHSSVLGVLGVSVMFIQLLGMIFALLLARCIRKLKSERALAAWRIKEQMILQRQDNEAQKELY